MPRRGTGGPTIAPCAARTVAGLFVITLAVISTGCGHRAAGGGGETTVALRDTGDDPAKVRAGFGNERLHTWWPLTAPELAALAGLEQARAGNARALLALAIVSSGDLRDADGALRIQQRVDAFVAAVKPIIDRAGDDWHKGYELHRAMHRTFFTGGGDLQGYDVNQPRLTRIFFSGTYNCLSSAVLFVVLARAFDLPVRAVVVPTHVFVEMGRPGTRPIEIETTSSLGFDLVHDARFFQQEATGWSGQRGLRPVTVEDYQRRTIILPSALIALAMRNVHPGEEEDDRLRRHELASVVQPDDLDAQRERLQVYGIEANRLMDAGALRTMARLFDVVSPALAELGTRFRDAQVAQSLSWLNWYYGHALALVGRRDQARAIMNAGIDSVDPVWPDAANIRKNYVALLNQLFIALMDAKDYPAAEALVASHLPACRADSVCAGNAGVLYLNWSAEHQNAGNWPAARQVLRGCVASLPAEARCSQSLTELESRHRF